jgi:hypothetical protein
VWQHSGILWHILVNAVPKAGYQPADVPGGVGPCPPGTAKAKSGTQLCRQCAGGHSAPSNANMSRADRCPCAWRVLVDVLCSFCRQHNPWHTSCIHARAAVPQLRTSFSNYLYSAHTGRSFQSQAGQTACLPCPKGGMLSADHRRCSESQQTEVSATDRPADCWVTNYGDIDPWFCRGWSCAPTAWTLLNVLIRVLQRSRARRCRCTPSRQGTALLRRRPMAHGAQHAVTTMH